MYAYMHLLLQVRLASCNFGDFAAERFDLFDEVQRGSDTRAQARPSWSRGRSMADVYFNSAAVAVFLGIGAPQ
jgi:hypothetical protein